MLSEEDYEKRIRRNMRMYLSLFFLGFLGLLWVANCMDPFVLGIILCALAGALCGSLFLGIIFMAFFNPEQNPRAFLIGPVINTIVTCLLFDIFSGLLVIFASFKPERLFEVWVHFITMFASGCLFSFPISTYVYASIELSERLKDKRTRFNKLLVALFGTLSVFTIFVNIDVSVWFLGMILGCRIKSNSCIHIVKCAKDRVFTKYNAAIWACYILDSLLLPEEIYNYGFNRNYREVLPTERRQGFILLLLLFLFFFFPLSLWYVVSYCFSKLELME